MMRTFCFLSLLASTFLAVPASARDGRPGIPVPNPGTDATLTADVGCAAILAPTGVIDSNTVVTPRAVIVNYGPDQVSFPVMMDIGLTYHAELQIESMPAGAWDTVAFAPWPAQARDTVWSACCTQLAGDINPFNDYHDTFALICVRDVSPLQIVSPADTIDSNAVVTPQVRVANQGNTAASFYTYFTIAGHRDSARVDGLNPGEERTVVFANWRAETSGTVVCRSWTAWPPDRHPENDTLSKPVFVLPSGYLDVAAVAVLAPVGLVREGALIVPKGIIRNNGGTPVNPNVQFRIYYQGAPIYEDNLTTTLQPHQADTVNFGSWTASPADSYTTVLRVTLPGDVNPTNDSTGSDFVVLSELHDVGVQRIVVPQGTIPNDPVTPKAWVKNFGSSAESFTVTCRIVWGSLSVYEDSQLVTGLGVDESSLVSFATWHPAPESYVCRCSTALGGDMDESNNWQQSRCVVESVIGQPGWHEVRSVPLGPSGKAVKDGADLTILSGAPFVFLLKGNKTSEFYRYSIMQDSWQVRSDIPLGTEDKKVGKGGALTNDGTRYIYATKGNNSLGFYRYAILSDSWEQLPDVPLGPSGKKVKGGTKLAYAVKHDTGYCYLLKGYKNEFWRFNTVSQRWDSLEPAPVGTQARGNKYGDGSFIVFDGDSLLYAVKAKFNELYVFTINGDTWLDQRRADFPLVGRSGRSKKVKSGAGGAFYHDTIYCLKGGNTQEFWAYAVAQDAWRELDTIPAYGSTNKKKKVKGGGAIALGGPGVFYVTKGNKTVEFWRYRIPPAGIGITEEPPPFALGPSPRAIHLWPNPARGRVTIRFGPGCLIPGLVRIYDITGTLRHSVPVRTNPALLDCRGLAPGVYLIKIQGLGRTPTTKLVID